MEAGRELDALVAEKVMGWPLREATGQPILEWPHVSRNDHPSVDMLWLFEMDDSTQGYTQRAWSPSTDMASAWQVVEKLKTGGYDNNFFFMLEYDNVELWDASFYKYSKSDGGGPEQWATANTAPLAICLAALKAVSHSA